MNGTTGIADLIILGLAVSQVVEVVRHSKLSMSPRKWAMDAAPLGGFRGFIAGLINCPFCLSHWIAGGFTILMFLSWWHHLVSLQFFIVVFAAARVANLSNDLFHDQIRTPKHDIVEEETLEDENEHDPDDTDEYLGGIPEEEQPPHV